jgi:hypothetical protein
MDEFVKVVKPSTQSLIQGSKHVKTEEARSNRFKPYSTGKPFERTSKDTKEKRRVEQYEHSGFHV